MRTISAFFLSLCFQGQTECFMSSKVYTWHVSHPPFQSNATLSGMPSWRLMFKLTNFSRTAPTVLAADWPPTPLLVYHLKQLWEALSEVKLSKTETGKNNHSTAGYILALTGMLPDKIDLIFSWVRIRKKGSRKSNFECRREQWGIGNNSQGAHGVCPHITQKPSGWFMY